jgi:hypothetical protein
MKLLPLLLILLLACGAVQAQEDPFRLPPVRVGPGDPDLLEPWRPGRGAVLPPPAPPGEEDLREERLRAEAGALDLRALTDRTDEIFAAGRPRDPRELWLIGGGILAAAGAVYLVATLIRLRRRL